MRLRTLEIHNIASIEDAFIDFTKEPLSGSEVFLITGKTGSGKSTILDAVCLALYADTPRLENTNMQGEVSDLEQGIKVKDDRQLMRRNTAEAWSRLVFEGNDGLEYEAEWYVKRARKMVSGKLQSTSRSLRRLSDGYCFERIGDIRQEIIKAVGLDFSQFCRTTMLAQGQFTRFLNSNDNEKAAILEKITGVDVYAKIGRKIYDVTSQKKEQMQRAKSELDSLKSLTEEEAEEKRRQEAELTKSVKEQTEVRKVLVSRHSWLQKKADLMRLSADCEAAYEEKRVLWESKEVQDRKTLILRWKETIEPRSWLLESVSAAKDAEEAGRTLLAKASVYASCKAALRKEIESLDLKRASLASLEEKIESCKDRTVALENAQSIKAQLVLLQEGRKRIAESTAKRKELQERVDGELTAGLSASKELVSRKSALEQSSRLALEKAEEALTAAHLPELRKRQEILSSRLAVAGIASERLSNLAHIRMRLEEEENSVKNLKIDCEGLTEKLSQMENPLREAGLRMDERRRILDLQLTTVDKWARKARTSLSSGDCCPVCGQKILAELPREEVLDELLQRAQKDYDEAKKEYERKIGEYAGLENSLKVSRTLLEKKELDLRNDTSLATAANAALKVLSSLGIVSLDSASTDLAALKSGVEEELCRTTASVRSAEEVENETKRLRNAFENARAELEKATAAALDCEKKLEQAKADCRNLSDLIEARVSDVRAAERSVRSLLEGSGDWKSDWMAVPEVFIEELNAFVLSYRQMIDRRNDLQSGIRETGELTGRVSRVLSDVLELMPQWKDLDETDACTSKLESETNGLHNDVLTLTCTVSKAKDRILRLDAKLETFISTKEDCTIELLKELNLLGSNEIKVLEESIAELSSSLAASKALLEDVRKRNFELEQERPELGEGDSLDSLSERLSVIETEIGNANRQIGALRNELEEDGKTRMRRGILADVLTAREKEFSRWSRLNSMIGSASGDSFRRIAQSYVLSALVQAANSYMKTLAPRYSLQVQPGTFIITIEDAFQGYARRAASTISGGESFLVSLSLALALSDLGTQLSVDTLFIDEGFGTLSGEPLRNAIETLRSLHSRLGRHVGIISHVEELQERIPVQIKVEQSGGSSSSRVRVV